MNRFLSPLHRVLILLGILISTITKADSWINPRVQTYYSNNKEFKLIITPKVTPDKYYEWNYDKNNKHSHKKRILHKKIRI